MKRTMTVAAMIFCSIWGFREGSAKTIRATELNNSFWSSLRQEPVQEITVEFRQGDQLPVNLSAEGDLIESVQSGPSFINVKKNFWLKFQGSEFRISLDGSAFKEISEVLAGSVEAGAGADPITGVVNSINVVFKTTLKDTK